MVCRYYFFNAIINSTAKIITAATTEKISGDRTQNHDHAITFVNLSTINTIVSKPTKPIPLLDELELAIIPP